MTEFFAIAGWLSLAFLVAIAFWFYAGKFRRTMKGEGAVLTSDFQSIDFGLALALATLFCAIVWDSAARPVVMPKVDDLVTGATIFAVMAMVLLGFLLVRGVNVPGLFGFSREPWPPLFLRAVGLLLAAMPLVYFASGIVLLLRGGAAESQEVVLFFRERVQESDFRAAGLMIVFGVVLAPICEEVVFRGYLYGAFKRFLGPAFALIFTAGLFAAIHLNATSFPALFILAVCLTLAYETTGSLLVPMTMHSLFNLGNLALMFVQTRMMDHAG